LATLDTTIKVKLPTTITIAGSHHQQIAHIQFNPHNRSILSGPYTNLYLNPLTQTINPALSIAQVHPTKGLTWRRSEKMAWAGILLQDTTTLSDYEKYAREPAHESFSHDDPSNPPKRRLQITAKSSAAQHIRGGNQAYKKVGRTTPAGTNPLEPTQEGFTTDGSPFEDEQTEADT
jgi:hypothetical protein